MMVVLAVVALAAAIVLPRLGEPGLALDAAARRLADTLSYARERAILGGVPMRVVLDLDANRWRLGRPARDPLAVEPDPSTPGRPGALTAPVRLWGVGRGGDLVRTGTVAIDLDPAGDALPVRIELADERGRRAIVVLPPAAGRAAVMRDTVA